MPLFAASLRCPFFFIPQEDNFVATMTVNETMCFYADIILPKTFDKFDRRARVAEVRWLGPGLSLSAAVGCFLQRSQQLLPSCPIQKQRQHQCAWGPAAAAPAGNVSRYSTTTITLNSIKVTLLLLPCYCLLLQVLSAMGLKHKEKTMVGGTLPGGLMLRGLSGGERKRLSIAAGILAAPSIVFLDEPTSGLDSFAALTVMGHLKRMARDNGHVVIASIHQPRSAIWSMFDRVSTVRELWCWCLVAVTMQFVLARTCCAQCPCWLCFFSGLLLCVRMCVWNGLPRNARNRLPGRSIPAAP